MLWLMTLCSILCTSWLAMTAWLTIPRSTITTPWYLITMCPRKRGKGLEIKRIRKPWRCLGINLLTLWKGSLPRIRKFWMFFRQIKISSLSYWRIRRSESRKELLIMYIFLCWKIFVWFYTEIEDVFYCFINYKWN